MITGWANIVLECFMAIGVLWGVLHEDDLIEFETIMKQWAKRGFKRGNGNG